MQLDLVGSSLVIIATTLIVVSEIMIQSLLKGAKTLQHSFVSEGHETFSFNLFMRRRMLWQEVYSLLWISAGIIIGIVFIDLTDITGFLFLLIMPLYFMGDIRRHSPVARAEPIANRIKMTKKWEDYGLYKHLMKENDEAFLSLINTSGEMTRLERLAKYADLTVSYDPVAMEFVQLEECEKRLREHLRFLKSNDPNSPNCKPEEIFVLLFMLSTYNDVAGEVASRWVSSEISEVIDISG